MVRGRVVQCWTGVGGSSGSGGVGVIHLLGRGCRAGLGGACRRKVGFRGERRCLLGLRSRGYQRLCRGPAKEARDTGGS